MSDVFTPSCFYLVNVHFGPGTGRSAWQRTRQGQVEVGVEVGSRSGYSVLSIVAKAMREAVPNEKVLVMEG